MAPSQLSQRVSGNTDQNNVTSKVFIAGVGRSGTTTLFSEMATAFRAQFGDEARYGYEPYLWEVAQINRTGQMGAGLFNMDSISAYGVHVHVNTPLFLRNEKNALHSGFIEYLYGNDQPMLVKAIRGNGRVEHYLNAVPDLKVIAVLRNPFDTLNSAFNFFSFLGDDFHKSDKHRLASEVSRRFGMDFDASRLNHQSKLELAAHVIWWEYMNKALIDAKRAFPDRVMLMEYESLKRDRARAREEIGKLLGFELAQYDYQKRVGPTTSSLFLHKEATTYIKPHHENYIRLMRDNADVIFLHDEPSRSLATDKWLDKYKSAHATPVISQFPPKQTPVVWRNSMKKLRDDFANLKAEKFRQQQNINRTATARRLALTRTKTKFDVSVIVPFKNAAATLDRTVTSILDQRWVKAQVILVDDASDDDSSSIAKDWARHKQVKLIRNNRNTGPGFARHRGIMEADSPFFSTLDADDTYYCDKLYKELALLDGRKDAVAFSKVEFVASDSTYIWSFDTWPERPGVSALEFMLGRRGHIPRDFTTSRQLYLQCGGFETASRVYEDWSFKMRLTLFAKAWEFNDEVGLTYFRGGGGGLSAGDKNYHLFYLMVAFLRNARLIYGKLGSRTIPILDEALTKVDAQHQFVAAFDMIRELKENDAECIAILNNMTKVAERLLFRDDLGYEDRNTILSKSAFL